MNYIWINYSRLCSSENENENELSIKGNDIVKKLKRSVISRSRTNMNDDSNDDDIDRDDDSSINIKNTHTDNPLDDLRSKDGDGKGEEVSFYKLSSEAAKKYVDNKFIEYVIDSANTL